VTDALTLVVCGAPMAARAHDVARVLVDLGWRVSVVASPAARGWLDEPAIENIVGYPPAYEQREADQPRRGPRASAVVVCPLTLNSGSKAATGIMDTYATGVLCEALATGTPITAVLMVSNRLWGHPAWPGHLRTLSAAGTTFVSLNTGVAGEPDPVQSGTGPEVVGRFDTAALAQVVGPPAKPS
jgi:phosphopantothenoylcysteine synthetase/decarboxylase